MLFSASILLASISLPATSQAKEVSLSSEQLRYGVSVANHDASAVLKMGFDWMAVYDVPTSRLPVNVMVRVPVNRWSIDPADPWGKWLFTSKLYQQLATVADRIEAYEIGNEVNLYVNGWEGVPEAKAYVEMLCLAYQTIKSFDPSAVVISAGLSPVGRISGSWNTHQGHNYVSQDEREYLREFLAAGGAECADAIGYHPNGFSATYDAAPDVDGGTPETNCANGFCFRGIEKIRQILEETGLAEKPIWATEVGWIVEPDNSQCLNDSSWNGRVWQKVSKQKQAENLVGAFQYAQANYPWLQAIFVFNLNFDQATYYAACEQMRYYSVLSAPAYQALAGLHPELQGRVNYLPLLMGNEQE